MSRSQEKLANDSSHKLIRDESVQRIEIDDETNLNYESGLPSEAAFDQSGQVSPSAPTTSEKRIKRKLPQIITAS